MISLILIGILGFSIWYKWFKPMNHFTEIGVKQTTPWPFFGDQWLTAFKYMSFNEFYEWVYNQFPNERYSGFYQFALPTLMIRDPKLIKQITIKDFDHFTDHRPFVDPEADPLWGANLFSLTGQKWREMRATVSGTFTSSKMKILFNLMNEAAEGFVNYFLDQNEDSLEVEMKDTYTRYTNDVIATMAFGIKVDSLNEPENDFYLMGKRATNLNGLISRIKFLGYMVFPSLLKLLKVSLFPSDVSKFFQSIIYDNIKVRKEQGLVRPDLIHFLMEANKKNSKNEETESIETSYASVEESADMANFKQIALTNLDIAAQAVIFFFGGFDTIATVMCFGSYELALNNSVQDKLRDEIVKTNKANHGKITYAILLKMKYLDMVVCEILRKWPPAGGIDRVVTKPYIIEPELPHERPLHLKPGDILMLPIGGLMRDPKYFPDPEKFDPERFSDENKDNIEPYTYLPFGSGPRNCIGNRFGLLEVKVLIYHLLLNFKVELGKKMKVPLKLEPVFIPTADGGFWLTLKRI
ncbi:unnamed protein product [Ceutorhynchus assimilis]|uniref:Cytochrome P450 n=1 Tax=Ceutorhynchus assimilis TaxID=467358 RepID=A0A9N9MR24_9CUCU|nr:unnamed protein product [Ceutorhynchus assimilis]